MTTVSVTLPQDGSTADVADYNTPITTIVTAINGNIDSTNVASLNGSKLVAASVPGSALDSNLAGGWITGLTAPTTVTYNGNRSYTLVFNSTDLTSTISAGMRLRTTRTVAAPTQCTNLNGTTQYYSKSSPAGMTFTDDFAVGAWVKLSSYAASSTIISRYNGTSGWQLRIGAGGAADGRVQLIAENAGSSNYSTVISYQSIPLNKWVHISAQLDMSTFTASTTTSYIMIDGVDAPAAVSRGGTNPTALVQAGNLEIGSANATEFFPGKIAQAFVTSAKLTQAQARAIYSQGLTSSDIATYSIVSAYSFNNSITDINTTNANNLTASGSAVATNADSPFGTQASGLISSTLDYGIVQSATFSTNTTVVVQVPEGCTIPTSGGVSAVAYSTQKAPYGFPADDGAFTLETVIRSNDTMAIGATLSWASGGTSNNGITAPIGKWQIGYDGAFYQTSSISGQRDFTFTLASALPTAVMNRLGGRLSNGSSFTALATVSARDNIALTSATFYRFYGYLFIATGAETWVINGSQQECRIWLRNAYL